MIVERLVLEPEACSLLAPETTAGAGSAGSSDPAADPSQGSGRK